MASIKKNAFSKFAFKLAISELGTMLINYVIITIMTIYFYRLQQSFIHCFEKRQINVNS